MSPTAISNCAREPACDPAGQRPDDQLRGRGGQHEQAGRGDRAAEADAGGAGQFDERGYERDRRVHTDPEQKGREVRRPDAAQRHHPHVDEGIAATQLVADPRGDEQRAGDEQPERPPRAQAPTAALADGDEQRR
jgi:hypothetical protein